jgi:hypothetical protein
MVMAVQRLDGLAWKGRDYLALLSVANGFRIALGLSGMKA